MADTDEDDVYLARVLRDAVGRACSFFWVIIHGFLSRDAVRQICQRPVDAVFAAV